MRVRLQQTYCPAKWPRRHVANASSSSSRLRDFHFDRLRGPRLLRCVAPPALPLCLPASAMWLFLISTPSERSRRWFVPPPQNAPHTCPACANPGAVFARIENFRLGAGDLHRQTCGSVWPTPLMRCRKFKINALTGKAARGAFVLDDRKPTRPGAALLHQKSTDGWKFHNAKTTAPFEHPRTHREYGAMHPTPASTQSCFASTVPVGPLLRINAGIARGRRAWRDPQEARFSMMAVSRRLFQSMIHF